MNGGEDMCVFKIGITANVVTRMDDYRADNFTFLAAIHCDEDLTAVESMEIHCVRLFIICRAAETLMVGASLCALKKSSRGTLGRTYFTVSLQEQILVQELAAEIKHQPLYRMYCVVTVVFKGLMRVFEGLIW